MTGAESGRGGRIFGIRHWDIPDRRRTEERKGNFGKNNSATAVYLVVVLGTKNHPGTHRSLGHPHSQTDPMWAGRALQFTAAAAAADVGRTDGRTDGLNIWAVQSRAVVHQIEPPLHSLLEVCQLCQNRNWCFIIAAKALIRNLNYPNPSPSLARLTTTSHATRPRENTTAGTMQQSVC